MKFRGYDIQVSDRKDKKYVAIVDGKKVHFGAKGYEHYHDKLGHYKSLDHNDEKRRESYRARHGAQGHQLKEGTPAWFSWHVLW